MKYNGIWKKAKRILALAIALALFLGGWGNYDFTSLAEEGLVVTLKNAVYTGSAIEPEIESATYNGENIDGSLVSLSWNDELKNAGTYNGTASYNDDTPVEVFCSVELTIEAVDLSNINDCVITIPSNTDTTYTGSAIEPVPTVTYKGVTVDRSLYTVIYGENKNAGTDTGSITVTPAQAAGQNVTGENTYKFNIAPKSIDGSTVTLSEISAIVDGNEHKPDVTSVILDEENLNSTYDYEVQYYGDFKSVGTHTVKVTGKGNYTGESSIDFTISYGTAENELYTMSGDRFAADDAGFYRGDVTITAVSGYTFTDAYGIENDGTDKTITATQSAQSIYLKNGQGQIFSCELPAITIDSIKPKDVIASVDSTDWTQSKTVTVSAADDNLYGVYYASEDKSLSEIDSEADLEGLTKIDGGQFVVTDEIIDDAGKVYYIYAVDKAGNVGSTTVTVEKIDKTEPTVTGLTSYYYKTGTDKVVEFRAEDAASGVLSVTSNDDDNAPVAAGSERGTYSVTFKQPGTYTITVADVADVKNSCTVTVDQDSVTPDFSVSSVSNNGGYTAKDGDTYYFADSLSVNFDITEAAAPSGEAVSDILVFRDDTQLVKEAELTAYTDTLTEGGTYTYTIRDEAGNVSSTVISIVCVKSMSEPSLGDETYEPQGTDVGGTLYFREDMDIEIPMVDTVGIARIEYKKSAEDDEAYKVLISYENADGSYQANANTSYSDSLKLGSLASELQDIEDGEYSYTFRVTNVLGKKAEKSVTFAVDKTKPESAVYVSYDTDGSNDSQNNHTGIIDFLTTTIGKVFGKSQITVNLYVKDGVPENGVTTISGMDEDDLTEQISVVDGSVKAVKVVEGSTASFEYNNITLSGYTHVKITVTMQDDVTDGNFKDKIQINHLKDKAGNTVEQIAANDITGVTVMYLDSVAPVLSADYGTGVLDAENNRIFYKNAADIKWNLKEAYYQEQTIVVDSVDTIVEPTVTLEGENQANVTNDGWTASTDGAENTYHFPVLDPSGETEYGICITYQDGSGNLMKKGTPFHGTDDNNGLLTNDIVVVDNKAPELIGFSISGTTDRQVDGINVYHNDVEGDDVTISFTVDDNDAYWNPESLVFKVLNKTTNTYVKELTGDELTWNPVSGRNHTAAFGFDGEDEVEAEYEVLISYADRAANPMTAGSGLADGEVDANGTYTSVSFILDHVAPEVAVTYSEAAHVIDGETKEDLSQNTPGTDTISYYGIAQSKIEVTVKLTEKYAALNSRNGLEDFSIILKGAQTGTRFDMSSEGWSHEGNVHTVKYIITGDGDYNVNVTYQDAAANKMVESNMVQGGTVEDGSYTSSYLVLDTAVPVVTANYSGTTVNTCTASGGNNGRNYFDRSVNLNITVNDQNIRYGELQTVMQSGFKAVDSAGNSVDSQAKIFIDGIEASNLHRSPGAAYSGDWIVTVPLNTEANYDIPIAFTDLAGNVSVYNEVLKSCTDTTAPEKLELSWTVADAGFKDAVNYKNWGFLFADKKLTIHADTADKTAGVYMIRFTVTDENNKVTEINRGFDPAASASYEVSIPLQTSDFKGTVKAEVLDWSLNGSDETREYVVESSDRHSSTGSAVITTRTSPSRTVDGKDFYNKDVTFNLTLKDTYSGLRSYTYTGGKTLSGSRDIAKEAGSDLSKDPSMALQTEFNEDMTLDAAKNNENDIKVEASFVDNAGHTGSVEQLYNIDITKPVITVEYDLNSPANEKFYNKTRTATVTIRERNFDPDDVDFTITNTDGVMPSIGSWSDSGSGDDTKHVCHVTFSADGDYTFTVDFMDMAGNEADYDRVDEFTVDQTKPVLAVTYDNNQSMHDYYYAHSRTATIDILEHNFDPAFIDVTVTADGAGIPSVSGWSRNGDHNIATVTFSADADYTFDISGLDQADNALDDYEMDRFVIDQTAPELEIFDIENMSANSGVVMPGIRYYDTNYDADGTVILMKGYHNGVQEMNGTRTYTANGMEIKLNDFEHTPENDDLYTMEATVYDLAGNSSEANVIFSVNRFGSVYTFDSATDELIGDNGKYYTNQEQDIVIKETNVDTLEFREITCNLNGSLRTLKEGEDFTVDMTGSDVSWKQYTYTIGKQNFEEEGTYILTVYSEDRAANTSDNNTKGKKVEFVVDKTNPSILIAGVENDGQYREDSREVTIDVQDNIRLDKVEVTVDGERTVYDAAQVSELDGKISFRVDRANHWQNMSVKAYDAAGNEQNSEEIRFLITSNILVQFYMNKAVFYSVMGCLGLAGAGTVSYMLVWRRRKKK